MQEQEQEGWGVTAPLCPSLPLQGSLPPRRSLSRKILRPSQTESSTVCRLGRHDVEFVLTLDVLCVLVQLSEIRSESRPAVAEDLRTARGPGSGVAAGASGLRGGGAPENETDQHRLANPQPAPRPTDCLSSSRALPHPIRTPPQNPLGPSQAPWSRCRRCRSRPGTAAASGRVGDAIPAAPRPGTPWDLQQRGHGGVAGSAR